MFQQKGGNIYEILPFYNVHLSIASQQEYALFNNTSSFISFILNLRLLSSMIVWASVLDMH